MDNLARAIEKQAIADNMTENEYCKIGYLGFWISDSRLQILEGD